jgi:hypothetical protein
MKIGAIPQFLIIGGVVGTLLPYLLSLCLFGTTLQTFVAAPPPKTTLWSGAPTPVPTPVPSRVQVWTGAALSSKGGIGFMLWSVLGALAGEAVAVRRSGKDGGAPSKAWLGAAAGSVIFVGVALCGLPR